MGNVIDNACLGTEIDGIFASKNIYLKRQLFGNQGLKTGIYSNAKTERYLIITIRYKSYTYV